MIELIDRQAALKKMCETCRYCEKLQNRMRETHPDFVTDKCNMYKFIAEQPTIEPEARRGRWEKHADCLEYCTNCSAVMSLPHHKFCGNCGARMDGGADNG